MTINIPDEQLQTLAKALSIAEWITQSSDDDAPDAVAEIQQIVLKAIHNAKTDSWVEYDKAENTYYINGDMEDEWIETYVQAHDDEMFWQTLEDQLARRDVLEMVGEEELKSLSHNDQVEKLDEASEKYAAAFAEAGVQNLRLV